MQRRRRRVRRVHLADHHDLRAGRLAHVRGAGDRRPRGDRPDARRKDFQITATPPGGTPPLISPAGCLNTDATLTGKVLGPAQLGRKQAAQRAIFKGANQATRANLDRDRSEGGGAVPDRLPDQAPEQEPEEEAG